MKIENYFKVYTTSQHPQYPKQFVSLAVFTEKSDTLVIKSGLFQSSYITIYHNKTYFHVRSKKRPLGGLGPTAAENVKRCFTMVNSNIR